VQNMRGKSQAPMMALYSEWLHRTFPPNDMPDGMTQLMMYAAWQGCWEKIMSVPKQHWEEVLMWVDEAQQ
jgi:hypothetical protein